uniref:Uncharacterized protein n=1 Tax=Setaria digitata TaxID=48799 RepID=A0A915PYE4_9BILA
MPDRQVQKNRRSQKGTASVRSIRKTLRSWRPTSARSSMSPSSRESIKSTRQRIKALFSRPMQEASLQKFVERIKKRKELLEEKNFKQDEEKSSEEATDEDLPMDSDILLEVQAGLRKLVKMPEIRIVMDPYAPLDYLKSRDKIFFTTEVVFSNTVRSMVNLNDEISNKELISMRNRKLSKILIEEPLEVTRYDEDNPLINKRVPIR